MSEDEDVYEFDTCPDCDDEEFIVAGCIEDTCCCSDPELDHEWIPCPLCSARPVMARREWARKLIDKQPMARGGDSVDGNAAIKLLKAEHARAVRIVKRAKRLELHGLRDTDTNEFLEGYEAACVDILAALTKGRA